MKTYRIILTTCALLTASACGFDPKESSSGGADGGSMSGGSMSGGTGGGSMSGGSVSETDTPEPLTCVYADDTYEDGEQFDTPDGCVRYRCEGGGLNVITDNRVTVEGDLSLSTQAEVEAQQCLGEVTGSLSITEGAADLTPLGQLTRVGERLTITASEAVTLDGLQVLREVGDITIADNEALTTLVFAPYMSVFGDVVIQNNDALASLAGAEFIGQCGNCRVSGRQRTAGADAEDAADVGDGGAQPADADGGDEPSGGSFYGNILIADNDALEDVSALGNLFFAWADVRFTNNAALTSLDAIPLSQVEGSLEISDHPSMETADVEAYVATISVTGTTTVCGNLGGDACP